MRLKRSKADRRCSEFQEFQRGGSGLWGFKIEGLWFRLTGCQDVFSVLGFVFHLCGLSDLGLALKFNDATKHQLSILGSERKSTHRPSLRSSVSYPVILVL